MHLLVLLTLALAAPAEVTAPGATLTKLAGGFAFAEGPAADAEGNVYFTDQPNDKILKWSVDGQLSVFLSPAGRANGLCVGPGGQLWVCADEHNQLWCVDLATKAVTVVVKDFHGARLNGPNDVWVRPDGGVYFTDPYYPRDYWRDRPPGQGPQAVYYLAPDRQTLKRVTDDLQQPNGLIGTADGKVLYVGDIGANRTWAYDVAADGSLTGKRLFCRQGSDGMTLDDAGHVFLTGKGVLVYDRDGALVQTIAVPGEDWTGNVCVGGRGRRTLFVTASKGLYVVELATQGVGSQ